jgi:hypothetical protein
MFRTLADEQEADLAVSTYELAFGIHAALSSSESQNQLKFSIGYPLKCE